VILHDIAITQALKNQRCCHRCIFERTNAFGRWEILSAPEKGEKGEEGKGNGRGKGMGLPPLYLISGYGPA